MTTVDTVTSETQDGKAAGTGAEDQWDTDVGSSFLLAPILSVEFNGFCHTYSCVNTTQSTITPESSLCLFVSIPSPHSAPTSALTSVTLLFCLFQNLVLPPLA